MDAYLADGRHHRSFPYLNFICYLLIFPSIASLDHISNSRFQAQALHLMLCEGPPDLSICRKAPLQPFRSWEPTSSSAKIAQNLKVAQNFLFVNTLYWFI